MIFLWSDICIFFLLFSLGIGSYFILRSEIWRNALKRIIRNKMSLISLFILIFYFTVAVLDSIHFENSDRKGEVISLLDKICATLVQKVETTYSAPFATHSYSKKKIKSENGNSIRDYPRLIYGGTHLTDLDEKYSDIWNRFLSGLFMGILATIILGILAVWWIRSMRSNNKNLKKSSFLNISKNLLRKNYGLVLFFLLVFILIGTLISFYGKYHILGTDKAGYDVFYKSLKAIRTGVLIGILTTTLIAPVSILFGVLAGYLGGVVDDIIQYVYTTLESIPSILLIAATMLIAETFTSASGTLESADEKLIYLCIIMGITSWTNLCRLIRGETLKLREMEYIEAAKAFGVRKFSIILRHIVPNIMHIVFIVMILRFSGIVLAEAVLTYVGIGVDPSIYSWGNMINQARFELARDPVVWWNLVSAFIFMVGLVLPANILGDEVRDILDPKLKNY